jgi:hypothetical protein
LGSAKIGEELLVAEWFLYILFSIAPSTFIKCEQKRGTSVTFFANRRWASLLSLLFADGCFLAFLSGFPTPFQNCLEANQYSL